MYNVGKIVIFHSRSIWSYSNRFSELDNFSSLQGITLVPYGEAAIKTKKVVDKFELSLDTVDGCLLELLLETSARRKSDFLVLTLDDSIYSWHENVKNPKALPRFGCVSNHRDPE